MSMVGKTYMLRVLRLDRELPRLGPRNVLIEPGPLAGYPSGAPFVRPFRGLRRQEATS